MKAADAIRITRRYLLVKMRLSVFRVSGRTSFVSAQVLRLIEELGRFVSKPLMKAE
jgi:hypothetical protein